MAGKHIIRNNGCWQVTGSLLALLQECRAEELSRFAIEAIHVEKGELAATDGRRLVVVSVAHTIPEGLYFPTIEGYLLKDKKPAKQFPGYKAIIPDKDTMTQIVNIHEAIDKASGLVLGKLCEVGLIVALDLYIKPIQVLENIEASNISVWVHKDDAAVRPFLLECDCKWGKVTYVQMPLHIKNKIEG